MEELNQLAAISDGTPLCRNVETWVLNKIPQMAKAPTWPTAHAALTAALARFAPGNRRRA
jgi:hypothetical protein